MSSVPPPSGYLARLAARTLGLAPLLRPATPSRFEPEGRSLGSWTGFGEAVEVHETWAPVGAPPAAGPTAAGPAPLVGHPEQRLLPATGHALSADPPTRPEPLPAVPVPGPAAGDSHPDAHRRAVPAPALRRPDAPTEIAALARQVVRDQDGDPNRPPGAGARSGDPVARAAGHPTSPAPAPAVDPPIIVRIGRVDVRAVHPPAPAPPGPPPEAPGGQSLAEYLSARDRGRR